MKKLLPIIALTGLALTILPPSLHLFSDLPIETTFQLMTVGMVLWFACALPWLGRMQADSSDSEA
ncbi:MAG: hypothetical protein ACPGN3_13095 [Opitutales bacterium]